MWLDTQSNSKGVWLSLNVETYIEQGLLGLAFHPNFQVNHEFVLNYSTKQDDHMISRVELWRFEPGEQSPNPNRLGDEVGGAETERRDRRFLGGHR